MSYLQNISRLKAEDNLAGLVQILVARKSDFDSIPDPVAGVIYNNIAFKAGRSWVTWDVILDSPRKQGQESISREGASKKNTLIFTIPKDRKDIKWMLTLAERDEFVVLYKDRNGQQKILGNLTGPMRFEFAHDSGAQASNLNSYACRFYYDGPENDFFYNGSVSTPAAGPAPAVVYFNDVAIASLAPGEDLHIESDYSLSEYFVTS